jgi:proteasome activator subunit 4
MTDTSVLPELGRLSLRNDAGASATRRAAPKGPSPPIPYDVESADDRALRKLKNYARSIPYGIEPNERMQEMLDFIVLRIVQCVEAKDYDPGLLQWDSMLTQCVLLAYVRV